MSAHPGLAPIPFRIPSPLAEPEEFAALRSRPGPVRVTTSTGDLAWLFTRYADVQAICRHPHIGKSHPDPNNAPRLWNAGLFAPERNFAEELVAHRRVRAAVARSFSARSIARLEPAMATAFDRALEEMIRKGPPADLCTQLINPFAAKVIFDVLGLPVEGRELLQSWSRRMRLDHDRAAAEGARESMREYLAQHLPLGLTRGCSDYDAARLLVTDYDAAATRIAYGIYYLLVHPLQRALLQRDPEMITSAVEEMVRRSVPGGSWLPRYARADIPFGGITIRMGDLVVSSLQSANRDARRFARPEEFDIARGLSPHLGFGQGKFFCLGANLARAMMRTAIGRLLRRLPHLDTAIPPAQIRMDEESTTGGLRGLLVTWPTG